MEMLNCSITKLYQLLIKDLLKQLDGNDKL